MRDTRRHRMLQAVDRWMHFHCFEWRWICDLDEHMKGTPKQLIRQRHRVEALVEVRNVHAVGRSFRSHPSQSEQVG